MKKHNLHKAIATIILGTSICVGGTVAMTATSYASSLQAEAAPVMLKRDVLIDSGNILLGDLFENAGENAMRVVAKAPKPGHQTKLPATWLWRVANFYKLDWRPTSRLDEAIVIRDSIEMDSSLITEGLHDAIFQATGEDELLEIELSSRIPTIQLPTDIDVTVALNDFRLSNDNTRFSATYAIPATGKAIAKGKLNGKVHMLVEVALPNRRIQAGEIVKESDLEIVSLRSRKVTRKAITDPAAIVGMQVKRTLIPGRAIQTSNLQQPMLVQKNHLVIISLNSMGMSLSVQGKALENGARKEVIQVKNTQSGTIVEAVVVGPNKVVVRAPMQAAQLH